jgi:hypothetical protein
LLLLLLLNLQTVVSMHYGGATSAAACLSPLTPGAPDFYFTAAAAAAKPADSRFFTLWRRNVSSSLPEPLDPRVKQITIQQLIYHTSGFSNGKRH